MYKSVEEFKVRLIGTGGFMAAAAAVRLPFGNKNKPKIGDALSFSRMENGSTEVMYTADIKLISTLVKRGDEHAKVLRGIVVWANITAPRYWWQEMATYRVGCECLSSESTMHMQGKGLSTDELVAMKESLPEGTMQTRVLMLSYQTLRRIYFQRREHRLPQWRTFCGWIETLPFAKELILVNGTANTDK